jgi:hypothetical protein
MIFYIQQIENNILGCPFDFQYELLNSIDYQVNFRNQSDIKYIFTKDFTFNNVNVPYLSEDNIQHLSFKEYAGKNFIPVGSVEFVINFIKSVYGDKYVPKPLNVPYCLNSYTNRDIINIILTDDNRSHIIDSIKRLFKCLDDNNSVMIKSNEIIKFKNNGLNNVDVLNNKNDYPNGEYQISCSIPIESEYRCFISNGKLCGIQNYSGNFEKFPDVTIIHEIIDNYTKSNLAPIAYTLDIGVQDSHTFIIECHDFFSCGLYGFSNYNKLPFMFSQWWYQFKINNKLI